MKKRIAIAALIITSLALGGIFAVVIWDTAQQERWLSVHFPISCSPDSQRQFDLATERLHELRFNDAEQIYSAITKADPDCAIAYWGIAMSRIRRPVPGFRLPDDIRVGRAALRSAANAHVATQRERAYIAALALLFGEEGATDWDQRTIAYEQAMGTLAAREPGDEEAKILYALALNIVPRALDKDFRRQTKAAELLLVASARHPGLSHYLTYCLRAPEDEVPDAAVSPHDHFVSLIQALLAAVALIGLAGFFVAVFPVWSAPRGA